MLTKIKKKKLKTIGNIYFFIFKINSRLLRKKKQEFKSYALIKSIKRRDKRKVSLKIKQIHSFKLTTGFTFKENHHTQMERERDREK